MSNRGDESDTPIGPENGTGYRPTVSLSRYDFVLAVIPLAFLLSAVSASVGPVQMRTALLAGSTVGVLALVDALFRNPPGQPPSDT